MVDEHEVKEANRVFFDAVADVYEEIDGRRGEDVSRWLDEELRRLSADVDGGNLLDLGCGTGFVMRKSRRHFSGVFGVDLSKGILKDAKAVGEGVVVGDVDYLPFKEGIFNAVVGVALLHHCFDHEKLIKEAYRVLKSGGVFYTDHDISKSFVDRFGPFIRLYRRFFDLGLKYLQAKKELTQRTYELSECHHDGVDGKKLGEYLNQAGFREIRVIHHWIGLSSFLNKIVIFFGIRKCPPGFAPNLSVRAGK